MAQQTINVGTSPNDGTGTPLRTAFQYTNSNFSELYTAVGPSGNNIVVPGNATITGDLTVDTSTLKVDSANNRVGIGTASPGYLLDVQAATAVANILSTTGTNTAYLQISNTGGYFYLGRENSAGTTFAAPAYSAVLYAGGAYPLVTTVNGGERYRIASDGVATWSNVGGVAGTAMTLNSTGLGVGASPSYKLHVAGANPTAAINSTTATSSSISTLLYRNLDGNSNAYSVASIAGETAGNGGYGNLIFSTGFNGSLVERMRIDLSGNVGIGVAPSATDSTYYQALEIARVGQGLTCVKTAFSGTPNSWLSNNSYATYSAGTVWKYAVSSQSAAQYRLAGGEHQWFTASSGAAGTTITDFATAKMTLDASGRLILLASTTTPATLATNGQLTFTATSDTNLRFSYRGSDGVTRTANLTLAP